MNLTEEIRLYGLIGAPVAGSRSPWIHNTVFNKLGLKAAYLAFHVDPENLGKAIEGFRAIGVGGFNVTIPHKIAILKHLDSLDPFAEKLGAVNTVFAGKEGLRGYNTDGSGLVSVLTRQLGTLSNKKVLILGAGGAARGIAGSLLYSGVSALGIFNRTEAKAEILIRELEVFGTAHLAAKEAFNTYDLVINTTSVGMVPLDSETPIDLQLIKDSADICDIVYKPHCTRLIQEAEAAGHKIVFGIDMLIEQAILAEQIWFGLSEEDVELARKLLHTELTKALKE